jgi:hypothetical protein
MKKLAGLAATMAFAGALFLVLGVGGSTAGRSINGQVARQAALGTLRPREIQVTRNGVTTDRVLPSLSDGTVQAAEDALVGFQDERFEAADARLDATDQAFGQSLGQANTTLGCARRESFGNTRVNQDCTFRRQAEEEITYNRADPRNLVAGQNDSRVGYNQCGIDWSTKNGQTWGDLLPPFRQRTNHPELMGPNATNPNKNTILGGPGTGHTYDAGSDPALAVDSQGRAYFSCVVFDVASNASGLYVTQSPQGAEGSFYFNIPDAPEKRFMVVEDNNPGAFHDKNFIAADAFPNSRNRDNVYVTWTVFTDTDSAIFGSMSTDHGVTWSTPEEISGRSPTLCFFGDFFSHAAADANRCNFDQGSDPVVLPDGDLSVVFNNGNTPAGNPNGQQLAVRCSPSGSSTNATARFNCDPPTKVGDDVIAGEPQCDFGRGPEECIPGPFIRTNDFPRMVTENSTGGHLYVAWQDYRNGEFDIQLSQSVDGGRTWREVGTVNPDRGLDHYMPAVDQSPSIVDRNGVSYYRSQRVPGENTNAPGRTFPFLAPCGPGGSTPAGRSPCTGVQQGLSDYVLSGGTGANTPYAFRPVALPTPPPDGAQAGFNGDYSGLTINRGTEAHPIWSDTRNADPYAPANGVTRDEDVFTDTVGLPNGRGRGERGTLGR